MQLIKFSIIILGALLSVACVQNSQDNKPGNIVVWQSGIDTEKFWHRYTESKGGLTWDQSNIYPEYAQVKEGDTFLVEVTEGICLMEFFHQRWRRANDVRRWHDSINEYGGCPNVFD